MSRINKTLVWGAMEPIIFSNLNFYDSHSSRRAVDFPKSVIWSGSHCMVEIIVYKSILQKHLYMFIYSTENHLPHYGPGVDSASNRNEYQES
jgi:hypothetical protein